jgi:hypothetical protein
LRKRIARDAAAVFETAMVDPEPAHAERNAKIVPARFRTLRAVRECATAKPVDAVQIL